MSRFDVACAGAELGGSEGAVLSERDWPACLLSHPLLVVCEEAEEQVVARGVRHKEGSHPSAVPLLESPPQEATEACGH